MSAVKSSQVWAQSQQWKYKNQEPFPNNQEDSQSCPSKPLASTVHNRHSSSFSPEEHNRKSEHTEKTAASGKRKDLSYDDLLFLLSMLEGELQARDEVITVLRADKIDLALLESQYGFITPPKVLQALQRDAVQAKGCGWQEDIYEKPVAELDKLVEKQKESYRQMLQQVLLAEQAHKKALYRLEDEKRNHSEYMKKSDEFTNLLEQERERLKVLIDQEKVNQEQREEENNRKVTSLKVELIKLKSFALLVVDEKQRITEQLAKQTTKVQELQTVATRAQEELNSAHTRAQEFESKLLCLEAQLHDQANRFNKEKEAMTAKLSSEDSQSRGLRQKLTMLSHQLNELEESNKILRRAEDELQDLQDKISRGECGNNPMLVSEVKELRKRVLEMEGKDEELIKMQDMCKDLNKKLEKESNQNQNLKMEVDKLNHRITELEKLEDAFGKSKQECSTLKCSLEKEKTVTKQMCNELDILRVRIKELEAAEGQMEKTEWTLKEDITKLKTLTVMLVNQRKAMSEKLKHLEEKVQNSTGRLQAEQDKVTLVTEKLIGESKNALKSKAELEEKMFVAIKERDEFKTKLKDEKEKNLDLQSKVNMMKKLQSLENVETDILRNQVKEENKNGPIPNCLQHEDNKIKDFTQEVNWLKWKLTDINVVEDDQLKKKDAYNLVENNYSHEHQYTKALMEELQITQKELSRYQLVEKENSNQKHILYKRLKEEEARSSHLTKEVEALKEKVHTYMSTDEFIFRMKTEHETLKRKLTQQEIRNKELAREMETITRELERYHRFSKSLRPGMNGRRLSDLQISTKEVQTEPVERDTSYHKNLGLPEQAVMNGKLYEERYLEDKTTFNEITLTNYSLPLLKNVNILENIKQTRSTTSKSGQNTKSNSKKMHTIQNGTQVHQGDMFVTHSPGQPLHIKVTPDHGHNTATLEITSPATDNVQSYTTTAVITTCGRPPKQQITLIQNESVSLHNNSKVSHPTESPCPLDQSISPLNITSTNSQKVGSEFQTLLNAERTKLPIEMESVTTGAFDKSQSKEETVQTVICVKPPKQNICQIQKSGSSSPNAITTADNKIHIQVGSPYIQAIKSIAHPPSPCSSPPQEQSTSVITNDTNKDNKTIASSVMMKSTPQPAQITISTLQVNIDDIRTLKELVWNYVVNKKTVQSCHQSYFKESKIPLEAFRQSGPTRIRKPKPAMQ